MFFFWPFITRYLSPACKAAGLALALFGPPILYAQQPAHFMLGEDQFRGLQIYDVVQDRDLNYLFATNEGIYLFDYYQYKRLDCAGARSDEVFNFITGANGTVYCNNLNGQVLQVKDQQCSVFYELAPDENRSDLNLCIGNDGHLLVGGKKLVALDINGHVLQKKTIGSYLGEPYKSVNGNIFYHLGEGNAVMVYNKGQLSTQKLQTNFDLPNTKTVLKFIRFKNNTYALDHNHKRLFSFDENNFALQELGQQTVFDRGSRIRTYYTPQNVLWVAGMVNGLACIDSSFANQKVFFDHFFISDVYADHEGNILLSTFDRGVIVVPDLHVPGVIKTFQEDPATSVKADNGMGVLLGTSKGDLMQYHQTIFTTLDQNGSRPIESIYSKNDFPFLVYDDGTIQIRHKKTGETTLHPNASLKDVAIVSDSLFYTGSNLGVMRCTKKPSAGWQFTQVDALRLRIHALEYIRQPKGNLYAATAQGLMVLPNGGSLAPVLYKNEKIFTSELAVNGDTLYACGKKGRLYKIYDHQAVRVLNLRVDGRQVYTTKIMVKGGHIYVKSGGQLHMFSLAGTYKGNLGLQNGFAGQHTIDFDLTNEFLYVVHTGGFQQVVLNREQKTTVPPSVKISGVFVNDQRIDAGSAAGLGSHQRKIKFQVVSPGLRNIGRINFWYQLKGYEKTWTNAGPGFNQVTYNALAPGEYTFMVKAENQLVFGQPVSFSFSIAPPFYITTWFIALCILLFLCLVLLVYKWQLRRQRKKAHVLNEINSSRLAAIRSQMNPHFIFNSLNAIQDLVLKGDIDNSYTLITRFSDLIRRTLNYSDKDFIEFDQEIKLVELYLSLEKLRFKASLQYTIEAGEMDEIMIPPMLIQPFIENALLHGLLHKEGQKQLHIKFRLEEMLVCTIEDNGVGREMAREIKMRQAPGHESFSGQAIKKRFEILSHHFNSRLGFEYEDLVENNKPSGTRVTLYIPVKHKF